MNTKEELCDSITNIELEIEFQNKLNRDYLKKYSKQIYEKELEKFSVQDKELKRLQQEADEINLKVRNEYSSYITESGKKNIVHDKKEIIKKLLSLNLFTEEEIKSKFKDSFCSKELPNSQENKDKNNNNDKKDLQDKEEDSNIANIVALPDECILPNNGIYGNDEDDDEEDERTQCKLCYENKADCILIECGHIIGCTDCTGRLNIANGKLKKKPTKKDGLIRKGEILCVLCKKYMTKYMQIKYN